MGHAPPSVHRSQKYVILRVVFRRGAREHVQRRFGHICVSTSDNQAKKASLITRLAKLKQF